MELAEQLEAAKDYILRVVYRAKLNETLKGFYLSSWKEKDIATTQFEPTDAHRCFPCWDEPALKATFSVDMAVTRGLEVISNTPAKQRKTDGENVIFAFEVTPVMSTYLVAFVVGEFDFVSARTRMELRSEFILFREKFWLQHCSFQGQLCCSGGLL